MAKIQRQTQKIFGQNAGSRQITAFGTAKTEAPQYTDDVNLIQNSNFLQGWGSAVLPDKAPYEEDMNGLFYAITSQLSYIFKEGFPEYDIQTEYNKGSLVKSVDTQGNVTIYKSLTDDNTGNALSDSNYWAVFQSDGSLAQAAYEIGLPQPTFSNTLLSNEIWLEGQEVSRTAYANLFAIYGTTYGAGDGTSTFNLPDCKNRVLWGSASFGYINAGLPNITGQFSIGEGAYFGAASGACSLGGGTSYEDPGTAHGGTSTILFDASKSSGIYGNSSTVQPPAIKCRVKTRYQ